jgi:hypothetical protein
LIEISESGEPSRFFGRHRRAVTLKRSTPDPVTDRFILIRKMAVLRWDPKDSAETHARRPPDRASQWTARD